MARRLIWKQYHWDPSARVQEPIALVLRCSSALSSHPSPHHSRAMSSQAQKEQSVFFGPFNVTQQVFYSTSLSFALVNLKPLLPGHVLVSPRRVVKRLTDLTADEVTDLFSTVQGVQKMLARTYFTTPESQDPGQPMDGSFNIAIQDGPDAGQSVPHVHCHIIPRSRGDTTGDGIYDRMASEEGNVGGALWDQDRRPQGGGHFPKIEDSDRKPRTAEAMAKEAQFFREQMDILKAQMIEISEA